ncbi:hypothetical protein [Serinicoccus sediminis]|uniref:hypothetical protein n=1 Tax=Serinicoccus sediminis TaxID=2306021 RepID=UPI0010201897|nr:hypothetical protein [Serinicoccus sediminis]
MTTATAPAPGPAVVGDSSWKHLREVIEHTILTDPRTLQVALGPSEIGTACDRCLVHLLAGHKATEYVAPWLPTIGHAVHAWLDKAMRLHALASDDGDRWHVESRVTVGQIGGVDIKGNADLFDEVTGTVTDWKISGKPKIDSVRRHGASLTYQRQAQLYGKGYEDAGHTVRAVQVIFLPRNAVSLQGGICWSAPYDRQVAQHALDRANALHAGITSLGAEAVLAMSPPHTGQEFDCDRWPGEATPSTDRQLDGLIPQTPGATATGSTAPTTAHQ